VKTEEHRLSDYFKNLWVEKIEVWGRKYLWLILILLALMIIYVINKKTNFGKVKFKPSRTLIIIIFSMGSIYVIGNVSKRLKAPEKDIFFTCDLEVQACLDEKTGLLKSTGNETSVIPCNMLGTWTYRKNTLQRRINFKDDGTYSMEAVQGNWEEGKVYTGHWVRQGGAIVWRHDQVSTDIERNLIEFKGDKEFTLTEVDGTTTQFELNQSVNSQRCTK
jgi:hypothetical protein